MHTGDLATMDADGYCNIVGRIKDMVIRGGENVYPREIEEFLYRHPKIQDVQVFGVPDERYGEELCAWIKLRAGETLTEEEVRGVLPRPDRALQGAAAHPVRRRLPDDGDRQDAEVHHARNHDCRNWRQGNRHRLKTGEHQCAGHASIRTARRPMASSKATRSFRCAARRSTPGNARPRGCKLSDVKLLVPVIPPTFYAAGLNYAEHVREVAEKLGLNRSTCRRSRTSAIAPTTR